MERFNVRMIVRLTNDLSNHPPLLGNAKTLFGAERFNIDFVAHVSFAG